jgi:hypothetical protein
VTLVFGKENYEFSKSCWVLYASTKHPTPTIWGGHIRFVEVLKGGYSQK